MNNLLRAELFKLGRNRVFWTLTVVVTVAFALLHYLIAVGWWRMDNRFAEAGLELFASLALATAPFYFMQFLSTLAGYFVGNEFSIGVVKNIVMSGNRRSHIFLAKFIVLALGSVLLVVVCPLVVIIGGKLLFGLGGMTDPSALGYLARAVGLFLVHLLAVVALLMLVALLAEDSGKTIIISVAIAVIISVAELLRPLPGMMEALYRYSIFHHLVDAFRVEMAYTDAIQSVSIGLGTLLMLGLCGNLVFRWKEMK